MSGDNLRAIQLAIITVLLAFILAALLIVAVEVGDLLAALE